ncbi:MAG: citramalate synthase [Candidatus Omnitrophica bacterium]|nr:citramalate synthase [Candidatus Omnitrophota bacterium]
MQKVILYDTTLRDGSQMEGISLTVNDKLRIAEKLDDLGIDYIEGGWPGSNPKDMEFFKKAKKLKLKHSKITAFGSTRRPHISPAKDANVKALLKAGSSVITIFGKSWDLHVREILKTSLDENLKMIKDTVSYLKSKKKKVFFDAEHFFDGYRHNPDYALSTILTAQEAGAEAVILCDTNGGMLTNDLERVVMEVRPRVKVSYGIHCHNDSEMAVANSVAAVMAGCDHVQGTINGYGERCGNANLCSIIPALKVKLGITSISDNKLKELTEVSHYVAEVCNMKQFDTQPFVGLSAFAHKGGVHVNAVLKRTESYEHMEPQIVGNRRRILVSELSGKSTLLTKAEDLNLGLKKDSPHTKKILKLLQDLEYEGYHFEAAEASFELLLKRHMKKFKKFFELEGFRVINEKDDKGNLYSEATIKVKVKGKVKHTGCEGDGPVNALDGAIRKALVGFYPKLADMHLSDFKVRVLDEKAGTAAKVRVLIQSQDKEKSWWTIGVSENIIEACWQALVDSVEYKLLKG